MSSFIFKLFVLLIKKILLSLLFSVPFFLFDFDSKILLVPMVLLYRDLGMFLDLMNFYLLPLLNSFELKMLFLKNRRIYSFKVLGRVRNFKGNTRGLGDHRELGVGVDNCKLEDIIFFNSNFIPDDSFPFFDSLLEFFLSYLLKLGISFIQLLRFHL